MLYHKSAHGGNGSDSMKMPKLLIFVLGDYVEGIIGVKTIVFFLVRVMPDGFIWIVRVKGFYDGPRWRERLKIHCGNMIGRTGDSEGLAGVPSWDNATIIYIFLKVKTKVR